MNFKCKKNRKNLVAFIDRELPEKKLLSISKHLEECPSCKKEINLLNKSMDILLEWKDIKPSKDYDRIFRMKLQKLKAVEDKKREEKWFRHCINFSFNKKFNLAASVVVAAFIFFIAFFALKPDNKAPQKELLFAQDMEFLYNFEVIENSEALENFEVINLLDILEQELNG
jgi:hypothetical protein